jgi:hypothetical protein
MWLLKWNARGKRRNLSILAQLNLRFGDVFSGNLPLESG